MPAGIALLPCPSESRWEKLLDERDEATVFHRIEWLQLVATLSHSELRLYELHEGDRIVGVMPLFFFNRGPIRLAASPPPQAAAPYLGPVVSAERVGAALEAAAVEARKAGAAYVEFRVAVPPQDRDLSRRRFTLEPRSTFVLNLSPGTEELWARSLESSCRRAIRKAQQSGVVVEEAVLEEIVESYFAMAEQVFSKYHRPPPLSLENYRQIAATLAKGDLAKVFVARHEGRLLAAGIFPFDKGTVYYLDGVSTLAGQALRPNNLLHWEVIRWAVGQGIRRYDMVGAGVAGVARFKRTFGPEEISYTYCYRGLTPWASAARKAYALLAPAGRVLRYFWRLRAGATRGGT